MKENKPAGKQDHHYEEFIKVFSVHEADLRRFIRSLLPSLTDADDVLQQTALVIWRKFDQYDPETHFMKWACVIARFEALAYRRKMARDRLVFREDILDLMATEGAEELEERSAERHALETCLQAMSEPQRKFLTLAYSSGIKIKEMAAESGSSAASYYMRLKRLRARLQKCIEQKIALSGNLT